MRVYLYLMLKYFQVTVPMLINIRVLSKNTELIHSSFGLKRGKIN